MRYRKLGRTGLQCSEIGLGAAQIGNRAVPEKTAERVLRTALEVGINFIDTAAMYGESETRIGRYLPRDSDGVIVATKCGDYEVMEDGRPRIVVDYCSELHPADHRREPAAARQGRSRHRAVSRSAPWRIRPRGGL